ncbi:ABC transporter permease [Salinivibrio sp. IB574]|uniref:ABC transporter permease n=1 Tax=Salinivibrio sp. IB574 TaxID=1909444 RepID=UPI0009890808|nr:ABC transporter permease [Salinivibrio sp. IB574]
MIASEIKRNSTLLISLVRRELAIKYKGTLFGFLWSIITPIFMLLVYSTVFVVVFKAKWHLNNNEQADYALMLFVGLLCHIFISEVLTASSSVIVNNINLVKKVVFPISLLPLNIILSAFVGFALGIGLCILYASYQGYTESYIFYLWLPYVFLVYLFTVSTFGYIFAFLGVFLRDITQIVPILSTVLLFTSTVFFSIDSAPDKIKPLLYLNPISAIEYNLWNST